MRNLLRTVLPRLQRVPAPVHRDLFAYADGVARDLEPLRETFRTHGRPDALERLDHDLDGYSEGAATPHYRRVPCLFEGVIAKGWRKWPLPHPVSHASTVGIRKGLRHLREIPELARAVESGAREFVFECGPPFDSVLARGLYQDWPGWQVTRLWDRVSVRSIELMIDGIAAYALDMHKSIDRRPAW